MAKFRRKPAVIEAVQFVPGEPCEGVCLMAYSGCLAEAHLHTANGPVCVNAGDWVIPEPTGGGFYPCKREVFEATYEPLAGRGETG